MEAIRSWSRNQISETPVILNVFGDGADREPGGSEEVLLPRCDRGLHSAPCSRISGAVTLAAEFSARYDRHLRR
jgi:hypothetical protein